MKAVKSLAVTACLLIVAGITCSAQPLLANSRFVELYTKEEFVMEYGEEMYNNNTPVAVMPSVKKPVQPAVSEKAEPTIIKGNKLHSSMFFHK